MAVSGICPGIDRGLVRLNVGLPVPEAYGSGTKTCLSRCEVFGAGLLFRYEYSSSRLQLTGVSTAKTMIHGQLKD